MPFHDHGGLGDDQPRAGALGIVFRHEVTGDMLRLGTAASEWRHEDAIRQRQRADVE